MLILLHTENMLQSYIKEVPEVAWDLLDVSDQPLTIIYPGAKNLAKNIISDDGSIGIRICKDEFCFKLLDKFRKPIVSTSANITGKEPPGIYDDISEDIIKNVDYVVKWRQDDLSRALPSSIIKIDLGGEINIIR